jgi:hypothetical protein
MGLLEPDVLELTAVAGVPAQRRPAEPPRFIDQEEDDLEAANPPFAHCSPATVLSTWITPTRPWTYMASRASIPF